MSLLTQSRHLGLVNREPLIILSCIDSLVPFENNLADVLATYINGPFTLILEIWQSWEQLNTAEPRFLEAISKSIQKHLAANFGNEIWIACNAPKEVEIAHNLDLHAAFLHHNAFVNENLFRPLPLTAKRFDSVYNAQMWTRKRHELAADISSICLVFGMHLGADARVRLAEVKNFMPHAVLANGDPLVPGGNYQYLSQDDVNTLYNQSRVGLCLSAYEGGSLASAEYLLAGIPVVSTASQGGRDILFEEPTALICNDTPAAVNEAVNIMISRNLLATDVRLRALRKIDALRKIWLEFVRDTCVRMGGLESNTFPEHFPRMREAWCGMPFKSVRALLTALDIAPEE